MMETTVNIIPFGNKDNTYTIGNLLLWNTGFYTVQDERVVHLYNALFFNEDNQVERSAKAWHHREDGPWKLVELLITSDKEIEDEFIPTEVKEWYSEASNT